MSGIFKEAGHESLYKRLVSLSKDGKVNSVLKARKLLTEMYDVFEMPAEIREMFSASFESGIANEDCNNVLGVYQATITGVNLRAGKKYPSIHQAFLIELEKSSLHIEELLSQKLFADAIEDIKKNELLTTFLWPEAAAALEKANSLPRFLLFRAIVAIEVHLSYMAVVEKFYETENESPDTHALLSIWPREDMPSKNPCALFFTWVKEQAGVKTMKGFFNHPKLASIDMEMVSLKRWSSGSHFPDREWLRSLAKALFNDENYEPFWVRHQFARTVNFLGHMHQSVASKISDSASAEVMDIFAPWPNFPHNYRDFASWGRGRYQFWREYACDYEIKVLSSQASV